MFPSHDPIAVSSTTNSYVDSNLTATITPTSASSKILVIVNQNYRWITGGVAFDNTANIKILRGSTDLAVSWFDIKLSSPSNDGNFSTQYSMNWLDSPATTSATTYKTQLKNTTAQGTFQVNNNSAPASITLLEIGA